MHTSSQQGFRLDIRRMLWYQMVLLKKVVLFFAVLGFDNKSAWQA